MPRPEGSQAPDLFYDDKEARKYNSSSRMINIQQEISERAIEMLNLPPGPYYVCYYHVISCHIILYHV